MFHSLNRRFRKALTLFICAFIFVITFSFLFFVADTLIRDSETKTNQLVSQNFKNCCAKFGYVESTYKITVSKNNFNEMLQANSYADIYDALSEMRKSNINIYGTILALNNNTYYSTLPDGLGFLEDSFGTEFHERLLETSKTPTWIFHKNTNPSYNFNDKLLYIAPLAKDDKIYGHFIIACNPKTLLSDFNYSNNIFLRGASVFLYDSDNLLPIYGQSPKTTAKAEEYLTACSGSGRKGATLYYCFRADDTHPGVILSLESRDLYLDQLPFVVFVLLSLLLIAIIAYLFAKLLADGITEPLSKLNDEMYSYINAKKSEK